MNEMVRLRAVDAVQSVPRFSSNDFAQMLSSGAFSDMRVELVRGNIEKIAPASGGHSRHNFSIAHRLALAFGETPIFIGTDLAVRVDENLVRAIDIAVAFQDFAASGLTSADSIFLAVEIADTTIARDLGEKLADYAFSEIAHYWVVDMKARVVHVMAEPQEGEYCSRTMIRFGEPLAVPGTDRSITID